MTTKKPRWWRIPIDTKSSVITGIVVTERRKLFLRTTDRRHVIAALHVVSRYETPRHTPGTTMVAYRAIVGGREFYGRAAGLFLTLREVLL